MDGSGNLYGTAFQGGTFGDGTVFELAAGSGMLTALASFNGTNGQDPQAALIMDGGGNLYGASVGGGTYGDGTVFELAAGSGTITTLACFDGTDGANPYGALLMDSGGNLYGTASAGGASGDGTVFELAKGSTTITTLASFNGTNGANPQVAVVMDGSGNLYGTTVNGGASGDGTVFEVAAGSGTITTLAAFDGTDGANPQAPLVLDAGGNLYGTAFAGGASSDGTVFELAKGSTTLTTLASFNGGNGANPEGALAMDGTGNLYGAAERGGATGPGTLFEVAAGSGTITALAQFVNQYPQPLIPQGGVIMDGQGNLYGTAEVGGAGGNGAVFELAAGSSNITALASLLAPNGELATSAPVMDSSGNLYGTAYFGGAFGYGTVYELPAGSSALTTLVSFNGTDGEFPVGSLVMDHSGNLYGITYSGGANGDGTVFEVATGSHAFTTLASFDGTNGVEPGAAMIIDSSGNLYGTAFGGGAYGAGTVFEVAAGSDTITVLGSFDNTNGLYPYASLVMDANGNLYGTAQQGGTYDDGTVFELPKGSSTITALASFNVPNGASPRAGVVIDSSGNLYGATVYGGAYNDGMIYEVAAGSGTITPLASFDGANGQQPYAPLIMDSRGDLYGVTLWGGPTGAGTVFEILPGTDTITTLASFTGYDSAYLYGGLLLDSKGNLYGAGGGGGPLTPRLGTVYEVPGAAAPTDQWTGANAAVDTNWSDGANWSLGVPPYPGQTVLFTKDASVKSFASTVDAGFTNSVAALDITGSWGGTITVDSPLTVTGNLTLASGALGGSGAVTVGGSTSWWTGGEIVVGSGGFTNTGALTVSTAGGDQVVTGAGTLTSTGTITETGSHSLVLENAATLDNAAGATFDLTGNGGVSQSGGGAFSNAGTLEKAGGTGTSTIATTTLDNTGTVEVNTGTLVVSAAVTQVSGKTLTAGTWTVGGSAGAGATLKITSASRLTTIGTAAQVILDGPGTTFTNLSGLTTISNGGSLSLLGGQSFTTARALTDKGGLTLGAGSVLTVQGSFTQTASGVLSIGLGGTNRAPTFGQLVSTTGTVTLAGSLDVTSTVVPAVGSTFELLDNEGDAPISGTFKRLPEGATLKVKEGTRTLRFQVSYLGTDADGGENLLITRLA
jgi:uncharacterized repeat protein (TIGR03803 family)